MDLKTGRLLWPELSCPLVTAVPVAEDLACDVLVMGAGVTGMFSACLFAEAGLDVVVIDRRGVARGSTPASTALIQYEIDVPLVKLAQTVGKACAGEAYSASYQAIEDMSAIISKFDIECDFAWRPSLFLAKSEADVEWFALEQQARQSLGIDVVMCSREMLRREFEIDAPAALYSKRAIELDPFKLVHGLARAAVGMGARIVSGELASNEVKNNVNVYTTASGQRISAKHIVVATGYETPEQFAAVRSYCRLISTYALATQAFPDGDLWPGRALIWESGSPYFYARLTSDNRVIIGGEDEPIVDPKARDALLPEKVRILLHKLSKLRPNLSVEVEYAWAGTFGESNDGLPFIGQLPAYPGCYFALGYGGNGITFALIAAQIIRDAITGRNNPAASIFRFDR